MELQLAEMLGKFHHEVLDIPCGEFDMWMAYFDWKHKQQEKANKKNKTPSERKGYTKTTKTL